MRCFLALLLSLGMCFPAVGTVGVCGHGAVSPADVQDVHSTGQLGAWPARQTQELLTGAEMEMPGEGCHLVMAGRDMAPDNWAALGAAHG